MSRLVLAQGRDFTSRPLPFEVNAIGLFLAFHPRSIGNARHRWLRHHLLEHAASRRRPGAPRG